jgi:hypothetical protein
MIHNTPLLRRTGLLAAALAGALTFAGCSMYSSSAAPTARSMPGSTFSATLSAASEVPPNTSSGTGTLQASLNKETKVLTWKVTYSGLTGPATAGHFHGPAMPGSNAGVAVPFASAASPIEGSATLTDNQLTDLTAGKWYVNVHTAANPGGEIRGQVMAQ